MKKEILERINERIEWLESFKGTIGEDIDNRLTFGINELRDIKRFIERDSISTDKESISEVIDDYYKRHPDGGNLMKFVNEARQRLGLDQDSTKEAMQNIHDQIAEDNPDWQWKNSKSTNKVHSQENPNTTAEGVKMGGTSRLTPKVKQTVDTTASEKVLNPSPDTSSKGCGKVLASGGQYQDVMGIDNELQCGDVYNKKLWLCYNCRSSTKEVINHNIETIQKDSNSNRHNDMKELIDKDYEVKK